MITQTLIAEIAEDLERAQHRPNHPSYQAFCKETLEQYRTILACGYKITFIAGTVTGSSKELFEGLDSKREYVIAVDGSPMLEGHPLAEYLPEYGQTLNSIFRSVHDFNGHYLTRAPFETFEGEITAYRNHCLMYSPAAQSALYGETVAQLCHYYAHGDFVPVQKCAILHVNSEARGW